MYAAKGDNGLGTMGTKGGRFCSRYREGKSSIESKNIKMESSICAVLLSLMAERNMLSFIFPSAHDTSPRKQKNNKRDSAEIISLVQNRNGYPMKKASSGREINIFKVN